MSPCRDQNRLRPIKSKICTAATLPAADATVELWGTQGATRLPSWGGGTGSFRAAVDALLDTVRTGEPHPCDATFGLRVTEILAEAEAELRLRR